ncbi:MAG: hypothetical protein WCD16_11230 [Paracoccaceae bacterium]
MDKLNAITELRDILRQMERDVGLEDLSDAEWNVLLAARNLTRAAGDVVASEDIRNHRLVTSIAQATYHRALRALVDMGLLERANGSRAKSYCVRSDMAGH